MPETKPKPVELPLAPGWKEYLESFQRACDRSSQEVAALIWTRLYDEGGPPINYRGNEEPDMILRWIHGQLGGRQGTFRTASRDVFLIKLMQFATSTKCETMSQTEESLGELASLIEVCQFRPTGDVSIGDAPSTCLTPQALRWAGNLANLIWISKAEPSAFAAQLADASQSAGSTLLSHILRLIAMFNPGNRADRWWSVLSNDRFQNSAVPALLGLARVSGSGLDARLGLPFVARILSERDRPEDLAFFIRGFERKDYLNHASQDSGDTIRNAIDVGDLRTLFCLVRRDRVDDFRTRFFKTLNALDYIPKRGNLEVWKEASCEDNFPRLVLWDSIDSPRFRNYPAVHAALVPALREARPDLFDKLQALFIQAGSTRIKQIQLGNIHAFRFEMRPVDELYFPINDSLLGPHTLQVATSEPFSCTEADRLIQLLAYRDLSDRDVKT
ncbi:MAG: hypothetical protein JWM11_6104, partial [Planctomycetaceae bacterium]|nr:hypothetical protein [Planctomycetaceae bacterium]